MTTTEFQYRLTGAGWSEAAFSIGSTSVRLTASYLGDALGDLVAAASALLAGSIEERVSWLEEPGEFRWIIATKDDFLSVRILLLADWPYPDEQGELIFSGEVQVASFCAAIAAGAQRVLDELGTSRYREKWIANDFPSRPLRELQLGLAGER